MKKTLGHPEIVEMPYLDRKIENHINSMKTRKNKKYCSTRGNRKRRQIIEHMFDEDSGSEVEYESPKEFNPKEKLLDTMQRRIFNHSSLTNHQCRDIDDFREFQNRFKRNDEDINAPRRNRNKVNLQRLQYLRVLSKLIEAHIKLLDLFFVFIQMIREE